MKKILILSIAILIIPVMMIMEGCSEADMTDENKSRGESNDLTVILEELSWLTGRWEGEAFGGRCEEIWAPPSAGSMVGMFKVWKEGRVSFYEIETITIDNSGISLNVKHFNEDLTGWEEKDEVAKFPFVSAGKDEIRFEGLTYKKISGDSLQIVLDTRDSNGKINTIEINCSRAD